MDKSRIYRYGNSLAFLCISIVYIIPLIKVWGYGISVFDFMGMSSDVDGFLEHYGDYTEFIQNEIAPYRIMCIVLATLPVCEAVAVFFLKKKNSIFIIAAGLVINNVVGYIFVDKLLTFLSYVNDSFIGLLFDNPIQLESAPVIIWCILHAVIFIFAIFHIVLSLHLKNGKERDFDMSDIIFNEVKFEDYDNIKGNFTKKFVDVNEEKNLLDDDFYGALVCMKGHYKDQVFMLKKGERVSLGAEDTDDIFIIGSMEKRTHCLISYDNNIDEYIVQPLHRKTVFLESGQPLGKDRAYCIPRGMTLIVDSGKNRFKLG